MTAGFVVKHLFHYLENESTFYSINLMQHAKTLSQKQIPEWLPHILGSGSPTALPRIVELCFSPGVTFYSTFAQVNGKFCLGWLSWD